VRTQPHFSTKEGLPLRRALAVVAMGSDGGEVACLGQGGKRAAESRTAQLARLRPGAERALREAFAQLPGGFYEIVVVHASLKLASRHPPLEL